MFPGRKRGVDVEGHGARAAAVTFRRWPANGSVNKNDVTLKLNSDWLTNTLCQERCVLLLCRFVVDDKNITARQSKPFGKQQVKCANLKRKQNIFYLIH